MTREIPPPSFDDTAGQDLSLVKTIAHGKPATKAERVFQQLVGKIARTRDELTQWQAYELRYNQRLVDEIEPLRAQLHKHQRQMVVLMDQLLSRPASGRALSRVERAKLSQLLVGLAAGVLDDGDDAALEALHDKHSEVSREQMRRSEMDLAQSMLNDVFGVDVGDDHGATTPEELLHHARRKMEERAEADGRHADDPRSEPENGDDSAGNPKRNGAQARREQAAREVSQSLRDIYRKLASALHPDRELDPEARQRKTLLMQRVNQAYDANDLLALLGLQLEIEQIDAAHLASVPPQRLAHYNKVLREQLAGLESELERHVEPFRHSTGVMGAALTPATVDLHLNSSVKQLRVAVREIREDLVAFRDPAWLREMLRHYTLDADSNDTRDVDDLMQDFADLAAEPRGKPRKRR